tara:strand:+ start:2330 stop:3562 length:1233 start_codon:yes stop_codon:yes gene_type:complete
MQSGTQGGKTCFSPHWLKREIDRCGPGDYLAVTATFPLLNLKMLPEFRRVFEQYYDLGVYKDSAKVFEYHPVKGVDEPTRVIFGSAANPESIESATAKGAWLDEAGQVQFRRGSWEAVLRRLSLAQGRVLISTTPYGGGWLKTEVYDKWRGGDPDYDVIQFDSTMNPAFPQAEFERARRTMPAWKFNLFYRGMFDRPAGLIYDSFDESACRIRRPWRKPPADWLCFVGHDFGPDNTAAIWFAQEPSTGLLYTYREYLKGGLSSAQHAANMIELSEGENIIRRVGGAQTNEDGYRDAYTAAGWPILKPSLGAVAAGIDRVYSWQKLNKMYVFDDLGETLDELASYSYKLDDNYEPITTEIENKQHFHLMDAMRYIIGDFAPVSTVNAMLTPVSRIEGAPPLNQAILRGRRR